MRTRLPAGPFQRRFLLFAALCVATAPESAMTQTASKPFDSALDSALDSAVAITLGERLFGERNFTNPAADYGSSCAECHRPGTQALGTRSATQDGAQEPRAFADFTALSLTAHKGTTERNTPTLLDVGAKDRFLWDLSASDLEALILSKLTGPLAGWEEGDEARAAAAIQFTLLEEGTGGITGTFSYRDQFREAYGVDLGVAAPNQAAALAARAIADYVRSLRSSRTAIWDAFAQMNRLRAGPNDNESIANYAYGIGSRIGNQEGRLSIKRPQGFSTEAYAGFRIFFRTFDDSGDPGGGSSVGNCVTCHVPPLFTDQRAHNAGVSQQSYDRLHGAGQSARFATAEARERALQGTPAKTNPLRLDLGAASALPVTDPDRAGAAWSAFATPTLRNLAGSDPYLHDGTAATLEAAIESHLLAAGGSVPLPGVDPQIAKIAISHQDVATLVAFLRTLNDVGPQRFRDHLVHLADE